MRSPFLLAWLMVVLSTSGCCLHVPGHCCQRKDAFEHKRVLLHGDGHQAGSFDLCKWTVAGRAWQIWSPKKNRDHARNAPVILLLHEMPCLSPESLELAERLSYRGYNVYVPLLFGSADDDPNSWTMGFRMLFFAVTHPEWKICSAEPRPVTKDLAELCAALTPHGEHLGVIGMCVSGNLPLQLLGQPKDLPQLVAAVVAQPALPFGCSEKTSSGLSPEEEKLAVLRIESRHLQVLGFRFQFDGISPSERFARFGALLDNGHPDDSQTGYIPGKHFIDRTLPASSYVCVEHLPINAHATLTDGYRLWECEDPAEPMGHLTYRRLVAFLDAKLLPKTPHSYAEPRHYPSGATPVRLPEEDFGGAHCPRPKS